MNNEEFREGQHVRILKYPKGHANAEARINAAYPDGRVWITNLNMPYQGTISKILSPTEAQQQLKVIDYEEQD